MGELPTEPWRYCGFDTETTGIPRFTDDEDDPKQPRLAEFGAVLMHPDMSRAKVIHHYVKPDGWEMPENVATINGLTTEFLRENGDSIDLVIAKWNDLVDQGYIFVAHNAAFDLFVMRGEMKRLGLPSRADETFGVCTMRMGTPICKLIPSRGSGYKSPKFQELLNHFGIKSSSHQAHTAAQDVIMLQEAFQCLVAAGAKIQPQTFGA